MSHTALAPILARLAARSFAHAPAPTVPTATPHRPARPVAGGARAGAALALLTAATLAAGAGTSPADTGRLAALSPVKLPALGADAGGTTVSGLSSGAFMASQLQVAYSRSIQGAGVVAGGPYYCAANNMLYTGICMGQVPFMPPNAALMVSAARAFAKAGSIDPLSTLAKRRIYVFSGSDDSVVRRPAVDATVDFYRQVGVPADALQYVTRLAAGHAVITPGYGNDCAANAAPYISHCDLDGQGYDQAGALLSHLQGPLQPRAAQPGGQVIAFAQREFADPATSAMAATGYAYVPAACDRTRGGGAGCKVHVAIHGCQQSVQSVGDQFVLDTGYNAWADSNRLIVLYPQVDKATLPYNPAGCWDWWGYTGPAYALRDGVQMRAIMGMVRRLGQAVR